MTALGIPSRVHAGKRKPLATPTLHPPTEEQSQILDVVMTEPCNVMINALAGCGKTDTMERILRKTKGPSLYLVFNAKNAKEAEARMPTTTSTRTFNSIGHRIWAQYCNKNLSLNKDKSKDLLRGIIDETPKVHRDELWASYYAVIDGVARAKAVGYVPEGKYPQARRLVTQADFHRTLDEAPDDLTADLIEATLFRSIQAAYAGSIDFNDQIYMPALFGGTYPRFPFVAVDEYQDLNATNHALLDRLVTNRLVGVGDPWQNIYGFRGAKQGGMGLAVKKFEMKELGLSVSFRCPRRIVENARWRVPHFKWLKEGGHVEILKELHLGNVPDSATFICRNNAPLFALAFKLLISGHSVNVSGSDIGPKIVGIMKRLGHQDMTQGQLLSAIAAWEDEKLAKESTTAKDMAACMRVFAKHGQTLSGAITYAEHLFQQTGTIKLMTGHKAKGLEFPLVYHLDPWLLSEHEQDLNLRYVIQTRSQDKYYEIDSERIVS